MPNSPIITVGKSPVCVSILTIEHEITDRSFPIIYLDLFKVDPDHLSDLNSRLTSLWDHHPNDLVVGTSSLTDPIERSRGFQSVGIHFGAH
jgi:hypothetical protein